MSYCSYIPKIKEPGRSLHQNYYDNHYGFPIHDDDELFGRLILEINQAGLSWETILRREHSFRDAYDGFNIRKVTGYTDVDRERLLTNAGIVRSRLKINAVIENAKCILQLQKEYGSFENWLQMNYPKSKVEWVKLFKKTFRFTGREIVNEFLVSIGYLAGAHSEACSIHKQILKQRPMWLNDHHMDVRSFINAWIKVSNQFDTEKYLEFYQPDAILDDPSVGRKFKGHEGIRKYFESYFIGYNTYSKVAQLKTSDSENAYLEVEFTGDFPEGKIGGTFDFKFRNGKIASVKADLLH